ncbi:hypothetical protein AB0M79_27390 [Polymorphospora sp. NPDC051019]|uniref:hypothetical protein n=1 Tax=Polymorphospora sp. NPDC051019 TaxID=3155725 RepID=UPI00342A0AD8
MVRSSWVAWCVGGLRGGDAAGIAGFGLTGSARRLGNHGQGAVVNHGGGDLAGQ